MEKQETHLLVKKKKNDPVCHTVGTPAAQDADRRTAAGLVTSIVSHVQHRMVEFSICLNVS